MKKIITFLLMFVLCLSLAACGSKEAQEEEKNVSGEEKSKEIESEEDGGEDSDTGSGKMYTLTSEDGKTTIQVKEPVGFDAAEYASETWLVFECQGESSEASTQYAMSLFDQDEASVSETMQQEVQYLLSANTENGEQALEVQTIEAGGRQWSYFSYGMEELQGYRVWTILDNGCIFACTAENVGTGLEPLDITVLAAELAALIEE